MQDKELKERDIVYRYLQIADFRFYTKEVTTQPMSIHTEQEMGIVTKILSETSVAVWWSPYIGPIEVMERKRLHTEIDPTVPEFRRIKPDNSIA